MICCEATVLTTHLVRTFRVTPVIWCVSACSLWCSDVFQSSCTSYVEDRVRNLLRLWDPCNFFYWKLSGVGKLTTLWRPGFCSSEIAIDDWSAWCTSLWIEGHAGHTTLCKCLRALRAALACGTQACLPSLNTWKTLAKLYQIIWSVLIEVGDSKMIASLGCFQNHEPEMRCQESIPGARCFEGAWWVVEWRSLQAQERWLMEAAGSVFTARPKVWRIGGLRNSKRSYV